MNNWEILQHNNGNSTYNLLFRYKPSFTYTVATANYFGTVTVPLLVFTSNSIELSSSLIVHWNNDVSNLGNVDNNPIFSNPYTSEPIYYSVSSGGGDPHIVPYFNPLSKVYVLPTDEKVYNYFDNLDEDERLVINAKMWVLDSSFIKYIERLRGTKKYKTEKQKVILHRQTYPFSIIDTSFVRYLSIIYKTKDLYETLIFDTELFNEVEYTNDLDVDNILLKKKTNNTNKILQLGKSEKNEKDFAYPNGITFGKRDSDIRKIFINTQKHGMIEIQLLLEHDKPNHRNNIELIFHQNTVTQKNCTGCLISLDGISQVSSLLHIRNINDTFEKINVITTDEYILLRKKEKEKLLKPITK